MEYIYNSCGINFRFKTNDRAIAQTIKKTLNHLDKSWINDGKVVTIELKFVRNGISGFFLPKDAKLINSFDLKINGSFINGHTYSKYNKVYLIKENVLYGSWDKWGGSCFVSSRPYVNSVECSYLIKTIFVDIITKRGFIPIHASGALVNNRGVLFVGDSGQGKSTAITYLLDKGFGFLGDGIVCLKKSTEWWIYPLSCCVALEKKKPFENFLRNCDLSQAGESNHLFNRKDKYYFNIKTCEHSLFINEAPLSLLVFPTLSNRNECRLKNISFKEISPIFSKQVSSGIGNQQANVFASIGRNVKCYELYLSKNLTGLEDELCSVI